MEPTVIFRDFEERDIDFIYRCKNDEKLNSMIVGQFRSFSREDAEKWVHGCMGEHETYKFWAIVTNDKEKKIIGWMSLSKIDKLNKSASFHGIVIADPMYRDGMAWIECYLYIFYYTFEVLKLHRLYGENIVEHIASTAIAYAMGMKNEGTKREALLRDQGLYSDIVTYGILDNEYFVMSQNDEYNTNAIIERIINYSKRLTV